MLSDAVYLKKIRRIYEFLLLMPDFLSSNLGILFAPVFLFLDYRFLMVATIGLAFVFFVPNLELHQSLTIFFLLLIPILIFQLKIKYFKLNSLYFYLALLIISYLMDLTGLKYSAANFIFANQHVLWDYRYAGLSLEPSFFAETFFPVLVLIILFGGFRIKLIFILFIIFGFIESNAKTFIQQFLFYLPFLIFPIRYALALIIVGGLILLSFSDLAIQLNYYNFSSWRIPSNICAFEASDYLSIQLSSDAVMKWCLENYGIPSIEAIFSPLPYLIYTLGFILAAQLAALYFYGVHIKYSSSKNYAVILAMVLYYWLLGPKWNFISLIIPNYILYLEAKNNHV